MKNVPNDPNDKVVMHAESTPREIDALTSATLKHLRDRWWDASFTQFLQDTLQPRAGNRILDVGCGTGKAEVSLGGLGLSQVTWFGIDRIHSRCMGFGSSASHNIRAALPRGRVASAICQRRVRLDVLGAVLQHITIWTRPSANSRG